MRRLLRVFKSVKGHIKLGAHVGVDVKYFPEIQKLIF